MYFHHFIIYFFYVSNHTCTLVSKSEKESFFSFFFTKQYSIVTSRQINYINKNERLMIVPFLIPSILYSQ